MNEYVAADGTESKSSSTVDDISVSLSYIHRPYSSAARSRSARTRSRIRLINLLLLITNLFIHSINCLYLFPLSFSISKDVTYISWDQVQNLSTSNRNVHSVRSCFEMVHSLYYYKFRHHSGSADDNNTIFFRVRSIYHYLSTSLLLPRSLRPLNCHTTNIQSNSNYTFDGCGIPLNSFFYTDGSSAGAIPLISELVSLPDIGAAVSSINILDVLPEPLVTYYSNPSNLLLSTSDSTLESTFTGKLPTVLASRSEYVKLVIRLCSLGMVTLTNSPKCINGAFGVRKDENKIRLIIDATRANSMMVQPPPVHLPNPSHLSNVLSSGTFFVAKLDLRDYYHQLRLPVWLQAFFCLPKLSESEVKSVCAAVGIKFESSFVFPMITSLPMGWSHSVWLSQCVHEHVLYAHSAALNPLNNMLINSVLVRDLHFIYIDDMGVIGYDSAHVNSLIDRVIAAYGRVGMHINVKKSIAPTINSVKVLGVTMIGRTQRLCVETEAIVSLMEQTLSLVSIGECTGRQLAVLIGTWVWYLLLRRSCLSVLRESYRFVQLFMKDPTTKQMWSAVKKELQILCCLVPSLYVDLGSSICERVIITDASCSGFGVVSNRSTVNSSREVHAAMVQLAALIAITPPNCRADSFEVACDVREVIDRITVPYTVQQPVIALTMSTVPIRQRSIVQCSREVLENVEWCTITSGRWKYGNEEVHINELELRSVLIAVKWLTSLVAIRGRNRRLILAVDNSVTLFSLRKGRSKSIRLLVVLRRIAALLLPTDVRLLVLYVPSGMNVADAASRTAGY